MPFDSTAELLFNISANSDDASANMEKFRELNEDEVAQIQSAWDGFYASSNERIQEFAESLGVATAAEDEQAQATERLAAAHRHAVSEIQATSGAIRLLEGSGGLRAMERFVATTLGIGPALQAIFPVVGALAFTEVIVRMGEKVYELYEQWDPVNQAEERATKTAKALDGEIRKLAEDIAHIDAEEFVKAVGEAAGKSAQAADIVAKNVARDKQMIAELTLEVNGYKTTIMEVAKLHHDAFTGPMSNNTQWQEAVESLESANKQLHAFTLDLQKQEKLAAQLSAEAAEAQQRDNEKVAKSQAKVNEEFFGLSSLLEGMKAKIAAQAGPWEQLQNEVQHYYFELARAQEELQKLEKTGHLLPGAVQRETAALAQVPALIAQIVAETSAKILGEENQQRLERMARQIEAGEREEEQAKRSGEALEKIDREINERLSTADEQGWAQQRERLRQEMAAWRAALEQRAEAATGEAQLTAEQYREIDRVTADGLAKIDRTQNAAFAEEINKVQRRLEQEIAATLTGQQRLAAVYQKDLQLFDSVEEAKAKKAADSAAERAQIEAIYAQMRAQITDKYKNDLQSLLNSEGWRGIFGKEFEAAIKGNEQLMRQWATSTNQSMLLVQVAMQGLKNMGQEAFQGLAQGMGQNIAHAIEYGTSIEKAMRQALAATLDSIASQAIVQAIYASGLGFLDLALGDYSAAGQAFTAAAIFGSIGAAAAVAGKYAGGGAQGASASSGSSSSKAGNSGTVPGTGDVKGAVAGGAGAQAGPNVQINIAGHVIGPSGAAQLCDIINQAVYNNDVNLYASHNAQGTPLP